MKVLVATRRTQGQRPDDFCFTLDGELVSLPVVVCKARDCGCERSMGGTATKRGTTTFTVADRAEIDVGIYRRLLRDDLVTGGWIDEQQQDRWIDDHIDRHLAIVAVFDVGDVLEIREGMVIRRSRWHQPAA